MKAVIQTIWDFVVLHKKYVLTIVITIIIVIACIILFNPVKTKFEELLSKKEIQQLKKENAELRAVNQQQIDTALFYKHLADSYSKSIDSSKEETTHINHQTHEDVNNIRYAPVDSNINKFSTDLEEYLSSRK